MTTIRNRKSILSLLALTALLALAGTLSASGPTVGPLGVTRTSADIMAQQRATPAHPVRLMPEHEGPERRDLPQDQNSPAAAQTPALTDQARRHLATIKPLAPQAVSTQFLGATLADTGAFPPDTMGTVGPTQFVVFLNGRVRTFNKTTGVADGVINADSDVFFSTVMTPLTGGVTLNFTSDPRVRYDRLTGRWILIIIDVPSTSVSSIGDTPNRLLVAVSDAASAGVISGSTVWTFYFVQQDTVGPVASTGEFLDYPTLGVDINALYVGGNMFGAVSGSFIGCSGFVIRKSSILSGGPIVTTAFRGLAVGAGEGPYTPQGVDNYDPAATEGYFIGVSNAVFGRLVMRRVFTPGATPTISADDLIPVSTTSSSVAIEHLGNTGGANGRIDALDDRLFAAHIRNGRLWTAHNIRVTAAGVASTAANSREGVRWYELTVPVGAGIPTVTQSGTVFDTAATTATSIQYLIPSVMVSGQGHAALGFSSAGTPVRINAATVGRLSGDTLGTTQGTPVLITASSTAYNPASDPGPPRRWGDYSMTSLDPIDDMTMWTIQEYCNATNSYGVQAAKLLAPLPATPTGGPLSVNQTQAATPYPVTGTQVSGSAFYDPGADLAPPALPFNHISATILDTTTVNPSPNMSATVTYLTPTTLTVTITTTGAAVGLHDLRITNPDGQSIIAIGYISVPVPVDLTGFSAE